MSKKAEYYLKIAKTIAEAGTCNRAQVGAVIVKNDAICST
jgi:deoxycytidylate deaminase